MAELDTLDDGKMTFEKATKQIIDCCSSSVFCKLLSKKNHIPFMEVIKKNRDEMAHSAFLRWLFSEPELLLISQRPLVMLLKLLAHRAENQMENKLKIDILTSSTIDFKNVTATNEDSTKSKLGDGRADIVITATCTFKPREEGKPLRIVIENKIDTCEGRDLCKKYYDHYSKDEYSKNENATIYAFLSPISPDMVSHKKFIKITYQEILDYILLPIVENKSEIADSTFQNIELFIDSITSIRQIMDKKIKTVIAMDQELRKLLKEFYDNNEDLIMAAIDAAAPDEIKEKVKAGMRDYSHYELTTPNGTITIKAKSLIAKNFIEQYLVMHPDTTFGQMKEIMDSVKRDVLIHDKSKPDLTYQIEINRKLIDWHVQSNIWGKDGEYLNKLKEVISNNGMTLNKKQ